MTTEEIIKQFDLSGEVNEFCVRRAAELAFRDLADALIASRGM